MDITEAIKDYAMCVSNNAITYPNGGTWISALCLYEGITEPVNGSWIQAYCIYLGINQPINGSWVIALADYYSITQPKNGTWWYAIADEACNGIPATPCIWGVNQNTFGLETRIWSATTPCAAVSPILNWENQPNNWEVEADNWEVA
jgi:hypothetical protein|tara:strand:- start:1817 stop:2257 length:441 start_codon:yes stop_codon:yes gene_type:complete